MRLRRETGDFQIVVTDDDGTLSVNTIRNGLAAEDFVGQIIDAAGAFEVVTNAFEDPENPGFITADCTSYSLTYTKDTGEITAVDNS